MRKTFLTILALLLSMIGTVALAQNAKEKETYFPYPTVPEEIQTLDGRCNYMVLHFWDRCNLKQSFSSLGRFEEAFSDWVQFMPYATADTVFMSVDKFLANVSKTGGKNMLSVGKIAENVLYDDSAEYRSEELYLPFCKAVAANKKVDKAERAHFDAQAKRISNCMAGATIAPFEYVRPDGEKASFDDVRASRIILVFADPESADASLVRARMAADYNLSNLVNSGLVKVAWIYPGAYTDQWSQAVSKYPEAWEVGAYAQAADYFDLPSQPTIYYLNARHKVLGKDVQIDNLLAGMMGLNMQQQNKD